MGLRRRNPARKQSITRRWFVNSFSVVLVLILILDIAILFMLQQYYYNAASQYMQTEANIIGGVLQYYSDSNASGNTVSMRHAVAEFDKKSQMELMAINRQGKVALMSSGFSPDSDMVMPDYQLALKSGNGVGEYVGRLPNGEKYMAVCVIISAKAIDQYSAIRMVTSLEKIDVQIRNNIYLATLFSILVLTFVLLLGLYFVKSIVSPIRRIGQTAHYFAKGDFSKRVALPAQNDEIGELCMIFNNMAEELENSETIKNDFISSVSHELRTPLTAIKGWTETIQEVPDDVELVERGMKIIKSETERLSLMVEDLLDFSHLESGKLRIKKEKMDVLVELTEVALMFTQKANRDGITVEYQDTEDMAVVYGDKNRLRQVFINLIDNAIKYSDPGGKVEVMATVSKTEVIIRINDSGCGISDSDLPKVKMRFYKANHSVRGSGIGLAVVEEIVNSHGGRLEIESELGVGTKVTVVLPKL